MEKGLRFREILLTRDSKEYMEEFIELIKSPAHWIFEILLIIIFDGIIGILIWPKIREVIKHLDKHK